MKSEDDAQQADLRHWKKWFLDKDEGGAKHLCQSARLAAIARQSAQSCELVIEASACQLERVHEVLSIAMKTHIYGKHARAGTLARGRGQLR